MGTNGNGEEIGWNKSENVLALGSQPPSQTSHESVWGGGDDIWCRDEEGNRKGLKCVRGLGLYPTHTSYSSPLL